MKMEIEKPRRKKNRLENYDYSSCGAYFITVCTLERRNYFWENVGAIIDRPQDVELSLYGEIVNEAISNISSVYPTLSVEDYVKLCRIIFTYYCEFVPMSAGDQWSPLRCHGL